MEATAVEAAPGRQRPFGISLLAVLSGLAVALGLVLFIAGAGADLGAAVIVLAITALAAVSAYGLWNLRWWAWPLSLVTWVVASIDAVLKLAGGTIDTNLVVGPLATIYLLQSDIRALFRRDA